MYKGFNLKNRGKPVPSNDMWIAAFAMQHGLSLFTYDAHFKNINGLLLYPGGNKYGRNDN